MSMVQDQKEETTETKKEVLTEVTSVAKEELKTGVKQEMPTPEEMVHRASASFHAGMHELAQILKSDKLSIRGKVRAMLAILDLPSDGIPVGLKKGLEQYTFAVGQRMIRDRFIITQYHVAQEQKIYKQLIELKTVQDQAIAKMKEEGKSEEEIKALQEKHKDAMINLEKVLRGEADVEELPIETQTETKPEGEKQ